MNGQKEEQMDDMISRQAAIKIIKNYCENGCDIAEDNWCPSCQREQFIKLLEALPSAQPDIIHCGECKHRDPEDHKCDCGHDILWQLPREDEWYCADAERKEGEEHES